MVVMYDKLRIQMLHYFKLLGLALLLSVGVGNASK